MSNALQLVDLITMADDDEPRVLDVRLAERLEFSRPRDVRQLIERNQGELGRYGTLRCDVAKSTGGRPPTEYYLNEAQALLICMRSDAPRAADVRAELIAVFQAWRHGRLIPAAPITAAVIERAVAPLAAKLDECLTEQHVTRDVVVRIEQRLDEQRANSRRYFSLKVLQQFCAFALHEGRLCAVCRKRFVVDEKGNFLRGKAQTHHAIRVGVATISTGILLCIECHDDRHASAPRIPEREFLLIFHEYQRRLGLFLNSQEPLPLQPADVSSPRYTDGSKWEPHSDPPRDIPKRTKSKQLSLDDLCRRCGDT
jgi:hypothetical protein